MTRKKLLLMLMASLCLVGLAAGWATPAYREHCRKELARCQEGLSELGVAMQIYSGEHKGAFPPLHSDPWRLIWLRDALHPQYLGSSEGPECPTRRRNEQRRLGLEPELWYLGYAVTNEAEGLAFLDAYREAVSRGHVRDKDLSTRPSRGTGGSDRFLRLRYGWWVESGLLSSNDSTRVDPLLSKVPLVIEAPGIHGEDFGVVLFCDGHIESVEYPGRFPMTERFIEALRSIPKSAVDSQQR